MEREQTLAARVQAALEQYQRVIDEVLGERQRQVYIANLSDNHMNKMSDTEYEQRLKRLHAYLQQSQPAGNGENPPYDEKSFHALVHEYERTKDAAVLLENWKLRQFEEFAGATTKGGTELVQLMHDSVTQRLDNLWKELGALKVSNEDWLEFEDKEAATKGQVHEDIATTSNSATRLV